MTLTDKQKLTRLLALYQQEMIEHNTEMECLQSSRRKKNERLD